LTKSRKVQTDLLQLLAGQTSLLSSHDMMIFCLDRCSDFTEKSQAM